jgi:predicted membrane protein
MRKIFLFLFCFFFISELSAQIVESDRQLGWKFIGFITQIVMLCSILLSILFGTLAYIGYKGKSTKKTKHKKRRNKHSSLPQEHKQNDAEADTDSEAGTEMVEEEQPKDTSFSRSQRKHSKYKYHQQSSKKHKNRLSKHKKWFRGVAFLSFLVFLFAFYMYVWAEREKNKHDDPMVIPPDQMW